MELFPGITREQALVKIERGLDERQIVASFQAENNLASDPTQDANSLAQENGRLGGQTSGSGYTDHTDEDDELQ